MLVWGRVRWQVVCLVLITGCWAEQRVDDTFTEDEWTYLQTFRLDHLEPITCRDPECEAIARFGQRLFFDPRYSGPLETPENPNAGKVACTTCHNPTGYFVDTRDANAQSLGVAWTGRNVPGLVDLGYRKAFTWIGEYDVIDDVLLLALRSKAAMSSTSDRVVEIVRTHHAAEYDAVFRDMAIPERTFENTKHAIGVYQQQLVSGPSPFDRYLAGELTAIDPAAKRGAQLFIGKALCSECHDGPLFADTKFHVTGVEQRGEHAPTIDAGRDALGRFRTPTLRHVAKTAPYMHAGQHETLAEVIEFYRWGGDPGGFVGTKDVRMVPLDLDDDDVRDLESFLLTLTGEPVAARWTVAP
jgi:cytochrome c peroxidase